MGGGFPRALDRLGGSLLAAEFGQVRIGRSGVLRVGAPDFGDSDLGEIPITEVLLGKTRDHIASHTRAALDWRAERRGSTRALMGRRDAGPTIIAIRVSNRLGGHCGGGLPACPSETLKSVGRIRESAGRSGLVGFPATVTDVAIASPAFWAAVTLWRPSDPASHHRRGRAWETGKGCDHADGTPAACLVAGRADRIALPEGARYDIVPGAPRGRVVVPAQCQTRHPGGAGFSARKGRHRVGVASCRGSHLSHCSGSALFPTSAARRPNNDKRWHPVRGHHRSSSMWFFALRERGKRVHWRVPGSLFRPTKKVPGNARTTRESCSARLDRLKQLFNIDV